MKKRCIVFALSVFMLLLSSTLSATDLKTYTDSIGMEFVQIPSGSFLMGAHESENGGKAEKPRNKVNISKAFYIGRYEVTQAQWQAVMDGNPSQFPVPEGPVETVSWDDVQEFIDKLNRKDGKNKYRLPTEAEWEYAARAGSNERYCYGDDPDAAQLDQYAWYKKNSGAKPQTVGKLKPNAWGLYDIHGNVWEWCEDRYDEKYHATSPSAEPKRPSSGTHRMIRGGSWNNAAGKCRSAARLRSAPDFRIHYIGFRVVLLPGWQTGLTPSATDPKTSAPLITCQDAKICVEQGNSHFNKGKYDQAIAYFTQAITLNPKYAVVYNNRGVAYENKGAYDMAIVDFSQLITLNPKDAKAYRNRGDAYIAKGAYDLAIADYTQAITLDPKFTEAYINRGFAYEAKKAYDLAIADYTQAITLNPKDADAYRNRGDAYGAKGTHDLAIADYTQAITLNPKDTVAYNNRGLAYQDKGESDYAIADYTQAITLNPKYPNVEFEGYGCIQ